MIGIASLVFLLIPVVIVVAVVVGISKARNRSDGPPRGEVTVRHVVVAILALGLFALAEAGAGWLLGIVLSPGETIAGGGNEEVAAALALTIVALPSFYGLWRYLARSVDEGELERSAVWSLFVAGANLFSLIGAVISVGLALDAVVTGETEGTRTFGFALAYLTGLVWSWTLILGRRRPSQLVSLPIIGGSTIGLWVTAVTAAGITGTLAATAYDRLFRPVVTESGIGDELARWSVWLAVGAATWWWYWFRHGAPMYRSTVRNIHVLLAAILPAVVTALGTIAGLLYLALTWLFGVADQTAVDHFDGSFVGLAVLAVAGIVWAYHRGIVTAEPLMESGDIGRTYRYLLAGVALVATVTGLGIVISVLLGVLSPEVLAGGGEDELLLGGITALVVGIPVWWRMWSPLAIQRSPEEIAALPRRIYLTLLAGAGGVVAIVAAITFLYQLFQSFLDGDALGAVVEATRGSLGVLVSTGIVAAYHFSVWRRERQFRHEEGDERPARRTHVTLAAGDGDSVATALSTVGAVVDRLSLDVVDGADYRAEEVLAAVEAADADRLLVILAEGAVSVYPLR